MKPGYSDQIKNYDPIVVVDEQALKQEAERKNKQMNEILNKRFSNSWFYNKPINSFSINLNTFWRNKKHGRII